MTYNFSDVINWSNRYSTWEIFSQHWRTDVPRREIVNQIMVAALKYRGTCAECRWGEPCGYNYRNLLNAKIARTCLVGWKKHYQNARDCCDFMPHVRFRLWLEAVGISRQELAELTGRSRSTITSYCLGKRKPKRETALIYAQALGIQVADLVGE